MVKEKGQSERMQLRPEPSTKYTEKRGRENGATEKQQTVPKREARKSLQGD